MKFDYETLAKFATHPMVALAGFVLTAVAFILAFVFYFKSKRVKRPCVAKRTNVLVEGLETRLQKVKVTYDGAPIPNLAITKLAFWNSGNEPILESDIASLDVLRASPAGGVKILATSVIYQKNPTNNARLGAQMENGDVPLKFEFIGADEGVVLQIVHTGSSTKNIRLRGTIKGVKAIELRKVPRISRLSAIIPFGKKIHPAFVRAFFAVGTFLVPLFVAWVFFSDSMQAAPKPFSSSDKKVLGVILAVITMMYWYLSFQIARRPAPAGFEAFLDEQEKKDSDESKAEHA